MKFYCKMLIVISVGLSNSFNSFSVESFWNKADSIVNSIQVPVFKNKIYKITKYGAVGDGVTDCTEAFKTAIEACSKKGGGKVIVPQGRYLTGAIHLLNNVNLHLEDSAEILFSRDSKMYLPVVKTRFAGIDLMNYSPFIYAYKQKNIAVTGNGILNGQANDTTWWYWNGWGNAPKLQRKASDLLYRYAQKNVIVEERVFGEGDYIRPNFVQLYDCENILIEGVTIINSPAWVLHPVLCKNVSVLNIKINSTGPNNDGFDPESCNGVYVKDCKFHCGDDCIAVKAGKDHDGRRLNIPCENIVIRNCHFVDGHCAIGIGSEMTGGVRNVFAENCIMSNTKLDRVVRLKTNTQRGGFVENVYVRNCWIEGVRGALLDIDMFYYDTKRNGKHYTKIRNVHLENLKTKKVKYRFRIIGSDSIPVENITIKNCTFSEVSSKDIIEGVKNFSISDGNSLQSRLPFPIGTSVKLNLLKKDETYRNILMKEFNSITPECAMKMSRLKPNEANFDFDEADYLVQFAKANGKRVHGHPLVWGKCPDWVYNFKGDSIAWEIMFKEYIQTVVSRYKGQVGSWDVVNEAIDDDGKIKTDNIWYKRLGERYIERAFIYAHEADSDALLFYNDYGHEYSNKRLNAIFQLLEDFTRRGVPVHGVGLQMHTRYDMGKEKWLNAINRLSELGLKIHISELDISVNHEANPNAVFTEELAEEQKKAFHNIVEIYAGLPQEQQFGITVWGISDKNTWIREKKKRLEWPLLFDDNYDKKPAYVGIMECFRNLK